MNRVEWARKFSELVAAIVVALLAFAPATNGWAEEPSFPIVDAEYYVIERMLVKEGKDAWFEDYWTNRVLPVFQKMPGFAGGFIATVNPDPELSPEEYDFGPLLPLGPPEKAFLPHGGIHLNGVVTDTQINFDSVMRGTYDYTVIHFWEDAKSLRNLVPEFATAWAKVHGEGDAWKTLTEEYFANLENHWDLVMRVTGGRSATADSQ